MSAKIDSVTMNGQALRVSGDGIELGDVMPDCELVNKDLEPVKLSSFQGKVCVISCMPSLDTPVCDVMAKRFSKEVTALGNDVVLLAVTMDLPFAQIRWCGASNVENVLSLSDHRNGEFGKRFGVLLTDLRLLARAVFVADKEGIIRYSEIVPELTNEPDYDAALKAAEELV